MTWRETLVLLKRFSLYQAIDTLSSLENGRTDYESK
jgi:hypothetical protein